MTPMEAKANNKSKSYNQHHHRPWEEEKEHARDLQKPNDEFFAEVERALELTPSRHRKRSAKADNVDNSHVTAWYGRNSSKVGIDSTSDFRQGGNARKACIDNDLGDPNDMVGFFDYGKSGADRNRPELNRLKAWLRANPGSNLIVEDVDRPIRDEPVLLELGAVIVENRINLYDVNGPVTEADLIKKGQAASEVRRMYRKRSMQTRHEVLAAGAICIRPPLGYNKIPSDLEKDEYVGPLIQQMFDKKLAGETVAGIVRWLDAEMHVRPKSGVPWDWNSIRKFLSHEIYIGRVKTEFEGKKYEFQREDLRLVTTPTWLAVQAQFEEEAEKKARGRQGREQGIEAPRIKPGATRALMHAFACQTCNGGVKLDSAGKSRDEKMIMCVRANQGVCTSREKFTYVEAERAVFSDIAGLLSQAGLDELFLEEDRKTEADNKVLEANRIRELTFNIEKAERKINQTWDNADDITPKILDFIDVKRAQVDAWDDERAKLRANQLRNVDDTELPSLAREIASITGFGPFTPSNSVDRQIFAAIRNLVRRIVLHRTDGTHAVAHVTLDFSSELGRKPGTILVEREVAFETIPTHFDWDETKAVEHAVVTGEFNLTDAEAATLAACPEVAETIGGLPPHALRMCLNALAITAALDSHYSLALRTIGLVNTKKIRNAMNLLRHHENRVHFVDLFHGLRPNSPGMNKLVSWGRPTRSARWELEKLGNPILLHPLAVRDAEDRKMTDAEWKIAFGVTKVMSTRKLDPRAIRMRLDELFWVLRRGATISSRVPFSRRTNFYQWFKIIRENGELEAIARALLKHEGIHIPD